MKTKFYLFFALILIAVVSCSKDEEAEETPTITIDLPDPDQDAYETVTCRFANDVQEFGAGVDGLYEFEVDLIEEIA